MPSLSLIFTLDRHAILRKGGIEAVQELLTPCHKVAQDSLRNAQRQGGGRGGGRGERGGGRGRGRGRGGFNGRPNMCVGLPLSVVLLFLFRPSESCLLVCLSTCLPACLPACLLACLPVYLPFPSAVVGAVLVMPRRKGSEKTYLWPTRTPPGRVRPILSYPILSVVNRNNHLALSRLASLVGAGSLPPSSSLPDGVVLCSNSSPLPGGYHTEYCVVSAHQPTPNPSSRRLPRPD